MTDFIYVYRLALARDIKKGVYTSGFLFNAPFEARHVDPVRDYTLKLELIKHIPKVAEFTEEDYWCEDMKQFHCGFASSFQYMRWFDLKWRCYYQNQRDNPVKLYVMKCPVDDALVGDTQALIRLDKCYDIEKYSPQVQDFRSISRLRDKHNRKVLENLIDECAIAI